MNDVNAGSDDEIDRQLAEYDANPSAPVDSTVRHLHAELETLAADLRAPLPPDPYEEEPELQLTLERLRAIGRDLSPETRKLLDQTQNAAADLGEIGPYRLLAKLGQGGMGTVYQALHTRLKKVVALKVLPNEKIGCPDAVARFEREMVAVGQLDHPHIVRAMDAGEVDGGHYLVMEYIEGSDLAKLLGRRIPIAAACELVRQAALGLQAAHTRGMVHRDIKPSNLVLARQEFGPPVVKVLDLGLALLGDADDPDTPTGITREGHIMGTIDYMAPEQAGNSHDVDIRADIYSLGATLYALLTGRSIFQGRGFQTMIQKLSALANDSAPQVIDQRSDVPPELSAIVARMLARDPVDRYATPAEVAAALEPFARGADLLQLLESPSETPSVPQGPTALVDSQEGSVGSTEPTVLANAKPACPVPEATRRRGGRRGILLAVLGAIVLLGAVILTLRTPHGEVIVELGDGVPAEAVKIEVSGNGELQIADAREGWNIEIKEGQYSVQLAGGQDRFQLDKNQIVATRGEQTVVRVTLKEADSIGKMATPAKMSTSPPDSPPTPPDWESTVQALPPEQQVQAVVEKLQELNPEFDGKVTHKIEEGVVTELRFVTDHVTDISPVAALPSLRALHCAGSGAVRGQVTDLSPLKGMQLETLGCARNPKLSDLSPLKGLPLKRLYTDYTQVADLEPLRGMPLETLYTDYSPIRTLEPLRGAPLRELHCHYAPYDDLSPLEGMKLEVANFGQSKVTDLTPLHGMPLRWLSLKDTSVADLSPLEGMPLEHAEFNAKKIADLTPLQGMPLKHLELWGASVEDLSPLKGAPLQYLGLGKTNVRDLTPLRGLKLLKLHLILCEVTDLSPLEGMPLQQLLIQKTGVRDLSPLKTLPLQNVALNVRMFHEPDETVLKSLSTNTIAAWYPMPSPPPDWMGIPPKSVEQFSKDFDSRKQAAIAFAAETSKLPPADKVAAVVARLKEANHEQAPTMSHEIENEVVAAVRLELSDETGDLAALRALSELRRLEVAGGPSWLDLSPVNSLPIEDLTCRDAQALRNAPVLQGMSTLKTINGRPSAEYLADLVAGRIEIEPLRTAEAEEQVQLVTEELRKFNPEFDGKVTHKIENGVVTELHFVTDHVTDISPVRALTKLRRLTCRGSTAGRGQLKDLSPLKGMDLESLNCNGNKDLADLSPLEGLPLKHLWIDYTQVSSLEPLRGMPLETLDTDYSPIESLEPLEGMPLQDLQCFRSRVSDLSPLKGMPLKTLNVGDTAVFDLTPLAGMPLEWLSLQNLRGVDDLSPLQGMPLVHLHCAQTQVADLAILEGMPLKYLHTSETEVADLSSLRGMALEYLNISSTRVTDLSPLAGMRLTELALSSTPVADLSAVRGMPLEVLYLDPTPVGDLALLMELPLTHVTVLIRLFHEPDYTIFSKPSLKTINGWPGRTPVDRHRESIESRRKAAEEFVAKASALPAEEQFRTIFAKLGELNPDRMPLLEHQTKDGAVSEITLRLSDQERTRLFPLRGLSRLRRVTIKGGVGWQDLSWLNSLPVEELTCMDAMVLRNVPVLQEISTLKTINGRSAADHLGDLVSGRIKIQELRSPMFSESELQAMAEEIAALPAEEQLQTVAKKLQELNPGFDGQLTHKIEDGIVTELQVITDKVTNVAPVAGLKNLKTLTCRGSNRGKGRLTDLSPLQGLQLESFSGWGNLKLTDLSPLTNQPLKRLNIVFTSVTDLTPLTGMPLEVLTANDIESGGIADLRPLQGLPLRELNLGWQRRIADLSPLRGMPLNTLIISNTNVADLSPLEGMPLASLNCFDTLVSDLSPLKGMPLKTLDLSHTNVADLSPLEGMSVESLDLGDTLVSELAPLTGMPLKFLRLQSAPVVDYSPLAGMPLEVADFDSTRATDLSPLRGMPLRQLDLWGVPISDLSPITDIQLQSLKLGNTGVSDLALLRGMPLNRLEIQRCLISDLSPLRGCPLKFLWCSGFHNTDLSPLSELPLEELRVDVRLFDPLQQELLQSLSVVTMNRLPREQFWTNFATRCAAAEEFAQEAAQLPANEQLVMVEEKLKSLNGDLLGRPVATIENDAIARLRLDVKDRFKLIDISPVRALTQLREFTLTGTCPHLDLSPINSLPIEELTCSEEMALRNTPVLEAMPTLQKINGKPAAEYLAALKTKPISELK